MTIPLRVLILKDHHYDVELMVRALTKADFDPDWQHVDSKSGYIALLEKDFDIILADHNLPGINAIEALRLLGENKLDIPFIVVTGTINEADIVDCIKHGVSDYLREDNLAALGEAVKNALDEKRLRDEKRRAEQALRAKEDRYRLLAENASDVIWIANLDLEFIYFSPSVKMAIGYSVEEALSLTMDETLSPESFKAVSEVFAEEVAGAGQEPTDLSLTRVMEVEALCKDGSLIWNEVKISAFRDPGGQVIGLLGVSRDISVRKRTEIKLARRASQLELLSGIEQKIAASLNEADIRAAVADSLPQLVEAEGVSILEPDHGDELVFVATSGPGAMGLLGQRMPATAGVAGEVMQTGNSAIIGDADGKGRIYRAIEESIEFHTRSLLAVPLIVDGEIIGVLEAAHNKRDAFDADDLNLFETAAARISFAIGNARLYETAQREIDTRERVESQLARRARQLETLSEIEQKIASSLNITKVRDAVVDMLPKLVGSEGAIILEPDHGDELVFVATSGPGAIGLLGQRMPADAGVAGDVMKTGESVIIGDADGQGRIYRAIEESVNFHTGSLLAVPLEVDGEIIGVLEAAHSKAEAFDADDLNLFEMAAARISFAVGNARLYETAQQEIEARTVVEKQLQLQSSALEAAANAILITDQDGEILWTNPAFNQMSGYSPEEVIGQNPRMLKSGIHKKSFYKQLWKTILAGKIWQGEMTNRRKNGSLYTEEMTVTPVRDTSGEITHFVAIKLDISARKRTETALRASEERFAKSFQSSPFPAFLCTLSGQRVIDANESVLEVTGYTRDEIIGRSLRELKFFVRSKDVRILARRLLKSKGSLRDLEFQFRMKNGDVRFFRLSIETIEIAGEDIILTLAEDITERKIAQEEIQLRTRQLEVLAEMGQTVSASLNLEEVLNKIVSVVPPLVRADSVSVLLQEGQDELIFAAASGKGGSELVGHSIPIDAGIAGKVMGSGRSIKTDYDTLQDQIYRETDTVSGFETQSLLAVPLKLGGETIGVMEAVNVVGQERIFSDNDMQMLEAAATWAASAIDNARSYERIQQAANEMTMLFDASQTLSRDLLKVEEIARIVGRIFVEMMPKLSNVEYYPECEISLYDPEQNILSSVFEIYLDDDLETLVENPVGIGIELSLDEYPDTMRALETLQPIVIHASDPDANPMEIAYLKEHDLATCISLPMAVKGEAIGFIDLNSYEQELKLTQDEINLAMTLANQAAVAIENSRLFEAESERLKEVNTLYQITQEIVASFDVESILKGVVNSLQARFDYYHVHIYLLDPRSGKFVVREGSGDVGIQLMERAHKLSLDKGIVGHVAASGQVLMTNNVAEVDFYIPNPLLPYAHAELAIPLKSRAGIIGVLDIQHQPPNTFDENDIRLVSSVADQLSMAIEKALLYTELQDSLHKEQSTRSQLVQAGKLTALGRIVASVAHELNNPLQAIQNALYLVRSEDRLSDQVNQDLQIAEAETVRMADLIARLRETYRPRTDQDFKLASLNELVSEVHKLIATHLRHNDVSFEFIPDPDLPETRIIADQIKQVLLNLSLNAIEAMPEGGQLQINVETSKDDFQLSITDTGPGIETDDLSRIFDPFYTTKQGGTGLGLAITYDIVQRHGGDIEVESELGKGSTFKVILPNKQ